jgi:hypothetical protein
VWRETHVGVLARRLVRPCGEPDRAVVSLDVDWTRASAQACERKAGRRRTLILERDRHAVQRAAQAPRRGELGVQRARFGACLGEEHCIGARKNGFRCEIESAIAIESEKERECKSKSKERGVRTRWRGEGGRETRMRWDKTGWDSRTHLR